MKILFAGGGTAGHVNPAIAIAEAMKKEEKSFEAVFVGREGGDESRGITERGYKLHTLRVEGLSRSLSPKSVRSIMLAVKALGAARKIIAEEAPDAVVATGGYVSWPVIKSAIRMGIPTVIHESNVYPGLVTRMLGHKCDKLLLGQDATRQYLKHAENAVTVGNPLREGFTNLSREEARRKLGIRQDELLIASFGGSLGSEAINNAVIKLMRSYTIPKNGVRHLHSAGKRYFGEIKESNPDLAKGINGCTIKAYIDDMPTVLCASDITISRSGALTLAELARAGCASILIPSPNVADNHQMKNAEALKSSGAALIVTEEELETGALERTVKELVEDGKERRGLCKSIRAFHDPECVKNICSEIKSAIRYKSSSAHE